MTWEIVMGLVVLCSAGIGIGKIIYELSQTLTRLNCSVEALNETLSALTTENRQEHEELYGDLTMLQDEFTAQAHRLDVLEEKLK